jgi:hypothetical protein
MARKHLTARSSGPPSERFTHTVADRSTYLERFRLVTLK